MRIIAGQFKGRRLQPVGGRNTRPTADHVREAIFNLLATRIAVADARVLDLFCGTGAFGLEALSRGAAGAVFVDDAREAIKTAASNAKSLGIESKCSFLRRDGMLYLKQSGASEFDIVFADPPYNFEFIDAIPALAMPLLAADGLLVLEHDRRRDLGAPQDGTESRSYGRTIVTIFRASSQPSSNQAETK